MSFVIFNPESGLYYRQPFGKPHSWVKEPELALKFNKQQRAKNFLTNNFPYAVRTMNAADMEIIDCNKLNTQPKPQPKPQPSPAPAALDSAGEADAQAQIDALTQLVDELVHAADTVRYMDQFYSSCQKTADLETIDLLHKIEFTDLDATSGFLLCRQLQEVRLRRRKAKDSLDLLRLFHESGLFDSLGKFQDMIGNYRKRIDTRSYLPRVLDELFESFPETEDAAQMSAEPPAQEPESTASTEPPAQEPEPTASTEPPAQEPESAVLTEPPAQEPESTASTEPPVQEPESTASTEPLVQEPESTASTEPPVQEPESAAPTEPLVQEPESTGPTEPPAQEPEPAAPTEPSVQEPSDREQAADFAGTASQPLGSQTPIPERSPIRRRSKRIHAASRRRTANARSRKRPEPRRHRSVSHKPYTPPRRTLRRKTRA